MQSLPKLHLITDTSTQQRYNHFELLQFIPQDSNIVIQFREKQFTSEKYSQLEKAYNFCIEKKIPLIINDYVSICEKFENTGIHVGIEDTPLDEVCKRLPNRLIGATVHNEEELYIAQRQPVSYIGVGPIFASSSKKMALPPMGLQGLASFCPKTSIPVIAIGGITEKTAYEVLASGAYGIAIIGAWCQASNPGEVISKFLRIINDYHATKDT
ncbi:MAG: thiamine phosphate synthase [Bacteroidia bacterium]|nr:thiamine phosphate synthase [Bacteroidia bacterium]